MVKLKTDYELNHLIQIDISNAELAIGQSQVTQEQEIELFQRSLALTNDLKKLPVLRGGQMDLSISSNLGANMNAAGLNQIRVIISLHNADDGAADASNRFASMVAYIVQSAGVVTILQKSPWFYNFRGGILLNPKMTMKLFVNSSVAAAGVALAAGNFSAVGELEIDWAEITEAKFKDYILESVYAQGDND